MQAAQFWGQSLPSLLEALGTSARGLSTDEASRRSSASGASRLRRSSRSQGLRLLLHQFANSIAAILIVAALLALFLGDRADAGLILFIVLVSGLLGFWQERTAAHAVEQLLALVRPTATVLRAGVEQKLAAEDVVPGDVVLLGPGDSAPGDGRLLSAEDLFVDEAALTGEGFPVAKEAGELRGELPLGQRTNSVFFGTHVVSGSAVALIVHTGRDTQFGAIAERLRLRPPESEFERGVRRFGYLLLEITLLLVFGIFAINMAFHRPVLDSFLFALALAVGLTPQLLPGIISVNLAHGARRMAKAKVIVRRLSSIENFGSMDVLCCDKTGTLTEGVVRVQSAVSMTGDRSERTLRFAYLNSFFQKGYENPIDRAIREQASCDVTGWEKLGEKPYDFSRKRLSVLLTRGEEPLLVTKGAVPNVLAICTSAEASGGGLVPIETARPTIEARFKEVSARGQRALAVAYRNVKGGSGHDASDEAGMTFLGFLILEDSVKAGARDAIGDLRRLGVSLKIITGDSRWVAMAVGGEVGVKAERLLTGAELRGLGERALIARVTSVELFAEMEPAQKDRIILALKQAGHVVGFMGDGINDATALHVADVGISVDSAADVAKEAADIVLLEKDLGVLTTGVREGRATFANTMKYVFMATSSNFGNMFSMAGASLLLPFLPLLPSQILLMNLLTDLPEMFIASDRVDDEMIASPHRWDIHTVRRFMLLFGLVSSVFDYLTFYVLRVLMRSPEGLFRTGWFVESVVSATLMVLVVRTRHPVHRSRPGRLLLSAVLAVVLCTIVLPYLPGARFLGFQALPPLFYPTLGLIVLTYLLSAEVAKRWFYKGARTTGPDAPPPTRRPSLDASP